MKPRITLLTLGVDDLERALRFYRDGLGWKTEGIVGAQFGHGAVAFFDLESPIVKPAHDTFWGGYAGYFQDLDGHLWEVAWNPQWKAPG
jgi:catechol 2,3-dioxygenase-like lactoylglutathione lyase family enzyme